MAPATGGCGIDWPCTVQYNHGLYETQTAGSWNRSTRIDRERISAQVSCERSICVNSRSRSRRADVKSIACASQSLCRGVVRPGDNQRGKNNSGLSYA